MKSGIFVFIRNFCEILTKSCEILTTYFTTLCNFAAEIKTRTAIMEITVIITIIVSTIVALAIGVLAILVFYYHWRNHELLVNFSAFIRENLKLKDEIERLQEENRRLCVEQKDNKL